MHVKWGGTQDLAELNAHQHKEYVTVSAKSFYVFLIIKSTPKVMCAMQFTSSFLFQVYIVVGVFILIFQALAFTVVTFGVSQGSRRLTEYCFPWGSWSSTQERSTPGAVM